MPHGHGHRMLMLNAPCIPLANFFLDFFNLQANHTLQAYDGNRSIIFTYIKATSRSLPAKFKFFCGYLQFLR